MSVVRKRRLRVYRRDPRRIGAWHQPRIASRSRRPPAYSASTNAVQPETTLHLPHFPSEELSDLPRITHATLLHVLQGVYQHIFERAKIIDCRFEYEFRGGHIGTARSSSGFESLADELFSNTSFAHGKALLVLYCERSMYRAPLLARMIRRRDRMENKDYYPKLTYPDLYVLEGGYRSFFESHPILCTPENYVPMNDKEHKKECERELANLRRTHRRQKL